MRENSDEALDNSEPLLAANDSEQQPSSSGDVSVRPVAAVVEAGGEEIDEEVVALLDELADELGESQEAANKPETAELPNIDMQSVASVTKATDVPLVLQSVPEQAPGFSYIDSVILPDNS